MTKQPMCGDTLLYDLARETVRRQRKKLRQREDEMRHGQASEGVHEMRIAIRKLRVTLQVFEELSGFKRKKVHRLRRNLRQVGLLLGAVRDLDVLLERIDGDSTVNERGDAVMLHAALVRRRADALKRLRRTLGATSTRNAVAALKQFPKGYRRRRDLRALREEQTGAAGEQDGWSEPHAHDVVGSLIWRWYEAIRAFGDVMPSAPPPVLHRVRITCKHLRYVLEMFDQSDDARWKSLLGTLKETQVRFGDLQDHANALAILTDVRAERPQNDAATVAAESAERGLARADVAPLWSRLTGVEFRRQLARYIAEL